MVGLLAACSIVLIACTPWPLAAQVRINEFCASNSGIVADPDFGDYADWVELYNPGPGPVNLNGYFLTDNVNVPEKWQISADTLLPAGGYLLIWADDRNTGLHAPYKIAAEGEELALYTPFYVLSDSVTFSTQRSDVSMGRLPGEPGTWAYFSVPTPGTANSTAPSEGLVFRIPTFSREGGMYTQTVSTEIHSAFGGEIRYTLDGSSPTSQSQLYSVPLVIPSTVVIRARVFDPGKLPGPVVTQSYFINENSAGGKLPVVSVATDPGYFWDPDSGLYTQDFKPEWEIPVNVELFENNGMEGAAFNERAGIKVNGLNSWQLPQKMLGVYFRNAYGKGNLDYRLTSQSSRYSYKNFALRASGSDWSYTLFRDVLAHHSTLLNMDLDIMGFRPAVVYVNGQYLGIHNIREKVDDDYIEKSHNMEPGTFDLVENQTHPEAGNLEAYNQFNALLSQDLSDPANYQAVAAAADLENFTDMAITQMACRNTSINHNIMAWKPKGTGKWKWVLMDLDRGFFDAPDRLISFYLSQRQLILDELFENEGYREYFAGRLATHLFTTYNPARMLRLIDEHADDIKDEMPGHILRWEGTTSSYGNAIPSLQYWTNEVCDLRTFVRERPWYLLADLQDYGFPGIASLILACREEQAATLQVNGMRTAGPFSVGPYLRNRDLQVACTDRPGYRFDGWYRVPETVIIPENASWRYNDTGEDPGSTWNMSEYDDSWWSEGQAELGYGDGDEATVISSGGGTDKNITTWFRKQFQVNDQQRENGYFFIHLKKDDGAVIYLNGSEIVRSNLRCSAGMFTDADGDVTDESEDVFITYGFDASLLEPGTNVIAAEIHQSSPHSSDVSFCLVLSCFLPGEAVILSSERTINLRLEEDRLFLMAGYETIESCLVPEVVTGDVVLSADCSPYRVREHVTIPEGSSLTVEEGVEIRMPESGSFFVNGRLVTNGSEEAQVVFRKDPEDPGGPWGGLVFKDTPEPSFLDYTVIEGASEGPDPLLENAAISAFNAELQMDHLTLLNNHSNPVITRFSDVVLANSSLHSEVTGDLINVKYGNARIEGCRFTGNDRPDTDAIDLDGTGEAVVRNCYISGFYGPNSDAIDLGEQAMKVIIDSVVAWNITDKGVSLGQWSSGRVTNSIFVNCNLGVAVKDSSSVRVENCIFYGTGTPVACYEKNPGLAGGNALVRNSILSNSPDDPFMADKKSSIGVTYSLSDTRILPSGQHNLLGDPRFKAPSEFDFSLLPGSPAHLAGNTPLGPADLGVLLTNLEYIPRVMISGFFVNGSGLDLPQYIMLFNPAGEAVDAGGYGIDKGVTAIAPEGTRIGPEGRLFFTSDADHPIWDSTASPVIGWSAGRLSGNGEAIRLLDDHGIVLDHFVYAEEDWPPEGFAGEQVFVLDNPALDNHFPWNWSTGPVREHVVGVQKITGPEWRVYPNPTSDRILIHWNGAYREICRLYSLDGTLLRQFNLQPNGLTEIDLSALGTGLYLIQSGSLTEKIMVTD